MIIKDKSIDKLITTVTPSSSDVVYVALPPKTKNTEFEFVASDGAKRYTKSMTTQKAIEKGKFYQITLEMGDGEDCEIDLSKLTSAFVAQNLNILTGELKQNVKISIADGATVTLYGVSINADGNADGWWDTGDYAGLTCEGDATIILAGGTSGMNFVNGLAHILASTFQRVRRSPFRAQILTF